MTEMNIFEQVSSIIGIGPNADGVYPFKIRDRDDAKQLYLVHYDESIIGQTSLDNPLRQHRGTIVSLETNTVVCGSIGYVPEITVNDANFLSNDSIFASSGLLDKDGHAHSLTRFKTMQHDALGYYTLTGQECFDIVPTWDGTNIRVWKHNDELLISTHGRINANNSKWGVNTQTFEQLFYDCAKDSDFYRTNLLSSLNEGLIAHFVILNKNLAHATKFPIGCDDRDSVLVFMGYRNPDNTSPGPERAWDSNLYPLTLNDFAAMPTNRIFITKFLEDNDVPLHLGAGYNPENLVDKSLFNSFGESITIFYEVNGKRQQVRFSPPAYEKRFELYNNQPNIFYRVHEIFTFCMEKNIGDYLQVYPPCLDITQIPYNTETPAPFLNEINGFNPSYSMEQLSENVILRFRNAMSWYASSLPLAHQRYAIEYTNTLLDGREKLANILIANKNDIFNNTLEFLKAVKFPKEAYEYVRNGIQGIMKMKIGKAKQDQLIRDLTMKLKGNFIYQLLSRYMYIEYGDYVKFSYNWFQDSRYNSYRENPSTFPCNVKALLKTLEQQTEVVEEAAQVIETPKKIPIVFDIKSAFEY